MSNLNLIFKQAPFVIVGGVATRLYVHERMILDLDILIKLSVLGLFASTLITSHF